MVDGVRSVDEEMHPARTRGGFDLFRAIDEVARASLHPEPVERSLAERCLGAFTELGGHRYDIGLEGALERWFELSLRIGGIELPTRNADPGAAARCPCTHIGRNRPVRPEREPDQLFPGTFPTGEDARPLGNMQLRLC
jgi:hypothetical protein